MRIIVETDFADVQRKLDLLQSDIAIKVAARSINRAIEQARTQMSREITREYVIDSRFVKDRLRIRRATFRQGMLNIEASLGANSKPRSANLIRFGARQVKGGVSVKIRRAGGRKVIQGAFIGNKGRTVFRRVGAKRLPIVPVQTINVPSMFNARRINEVVVATMRRRFPDIFEHELAYELGQFNR